MDLASVAGVDIGGTGVRASRAPYAHIERHALADRSVDAVIAAVERAVAPLGAVRAVGVAVPGFLDGEVVRASPNFPTWRDVPLGERLSARLGVPVAVENDATAAAIGCWDLRGGHEDLALLTLGTGVGGGLVLDGRPLRGKTGSAGELGHVFAGGDVRCGCGAAGCLETWASTSGFQRRTGNPSLTGHEVVAAAEAGETWALTLLAEAGDALGRGLRSIVNAVDPDVIALAGGLTAARAWLEPGLVAGLALAAAPMASRVEVVWQGRADGLAIRGAARAALSLATAYGDLPS